MTYRKMSERASPSCGTILRYFTLQNYLFTAIFKPFFALSAWASAAMRACGCSFLPSVTDNCADKVARQQRIDRQDRWSALLLPVRAVLYVVGMLILYPLILFFALLRALFTRLVHGGPWTSLGQRGAFGCHPYYPCQFVFTKTYDVAKLEALFFEMVAEAGIPEEMAVFEAPDEVPADLPAPNAPIEHHHYGVGGLNYVYTGYRMYAYRVIGLRVFNGAEGGPTVWHSYMPGCTWDGTSCFNFNKELISRYYSGEKKDVFASVTLSGEAKAKLEANTNFGAFLLRYPFVLWANLSVYAWQLLGSMPFCGGPGFKFEYTYFNFDETTSAKLTAALKARGVKPFAGFTWAGINAANTILGSHPWAITQQASVQTRHFEPKREREMFGDWLLGPQQLVSERLAPDGQYTLVQAHAGYKTLLSELDDLSGAVARAAEGKHYALVNNGAATFEAWPFYGDHSRVWDSLFFNNYGPRSVHEDAGVVSYNWGAPFYLCFNTLHINGKTCTCMASGVLGLDKLRAVRDEARRLLLQLVDDEQPLEPTKADSKSKSKSKLGLFSPKSKSKSKKSLV